MPKTCAVGGCTRSSTKNPQLSFLKFSADSVIRRQSIRFVNSTRSNFNVSKCLLICASHALHREALHRRLLLCLDTSTELKQRFGFTPKTTLKTGAVPTTLKAPNISTSWSGNKMKSHRVKGQNGEEKTGANKGECVVGETVKWDESGDWPQHAGMIGPAPAKVSPCFQGSAASTCAW